MFAGGTGDGGDGAGVAIHVTVDGGALAAAADRDLHAVAIVDLPEQPVRAEPALFPFPIVRDEVGEKIDGKGGVTCNQRALMDRIRGPEAVSARIGALAEPEERVIVQILRIADPAALAVMVAGRAVDGVVFAAP